MSEWQQQEGSCAAYGRRHRPYVTVRMSPTFEVKQQFACTVLRLYLELPELTQVFPTALFLAGLSLSCILVDDGMTRYEMDQVWLYP